LNYRFAVFLYLPRKLLVYLVGNKFSLLDQYSLVCTFSPGSCDLHISVLVGIKVCIPCLKITNVWCHVHDLAQAASDLSLRTDLGTVQPSEYEHIAMCWQHDTKKCAPYYVSCMISLHFQVFKTCCRYPVLSNKIRYIKRFCGNKGVYIVF